MPCDARAPIVGKDEPILVTGGNGFIGTSVVEALLARGFTKVRCLVRSRGNRMDALRRLLDRFPGASVEIIEGNLQSRAVAVAAVRDARLVIHLAAGMEKSFPGSYLNTVVPTRNLLDAVCQSDTLRRFVNISSLAVYSNRHLRRYATLDETCALEPDPVGRNEPYVYAKFKQDELVSDYGRRHGLKYVIVRPGAVYGPGKGDVTARVGIDTFGIFLHLGGGNRIPFTHVRNCAEAIVLAGITPGIDGEVFNVVDDDLPTSRQFMAAYARQVGRRRYIPVPYPVFFAFCAAWERYSAWSEGQLPAAFNRARCSAYWKGNRYSNGNLKRIGWRPRVSWEQGATDYFAYLRSQREAAC
jgi:nucleoside-diphosphate-sugar epimerase